MEEIIKNLIQSQMTVGLQKFGAEVKRQLLIQGHRNTGYLENSIDHDVQRSIAGVIGVMYMEEYGLTLDAGVKASEIVLSKKYIGDLIQYFQSKGLEIKEARLAGVRTALAHKREGMPTKGSYRFSKNGKRTGFVDDSWNIVRSEFEDILTDDLVTKITLEAQNMVNRVLQIAA